MSNPPRPRASSWRRLYERLVVPGLPYAMLVGAMALFSMNVVLGRAVQAELPPFGLSFWRWAVASALFLPFAWRVTWSQAALIRAHWRIILLMTLSLIVFGNTLIYVGLHQTTAINAGIVPVSRPVVIVVFAWMIYRTVVTGRQVLGIAVAMTGVLYVVVRGDLAALLAFRLNSGDLWIVAANFGIALYQVLVRRAPPGLHPAALLLMTMLSGALLLAPFYLWETLAGDPVRLSWTAVGSIAYLAIFPSIIAVHFLNRGFALVGPNRAGIFNYLQPIFIGALAIAFLGETLEAYHIIGASTVIAGIVIASRRPSAPAPLRRPSAS
jgi:drug/metabolite transporter (DMT)-like permease